MYIYIYIYMYICIYIYIHFVSCMYVCVCVCVFTLHLFIHSYTLINTLCVCTTFIHTYTHIVRAYNSETHVLRVTFMYTNVHVCIDISSAESGLNSLWILFDIPIWRPRDHWVTWASRYVLGSHVSLWMRALFLLFFIFFSEILFRGVKWTATQTCFPCQMLWDESCPKLSRRGTYFEATFRRKPEARLRILRQCYSIVRFLQMLQDWLSHSCHTHTHTQWHTLSAVCTGHDSVSWHMYLRMCHGMCLHIWYVGVGMYLLTCELLAVAIIWLIIANENLLLVKMKEKKLLKIRSLPKVLRAQAMRSTT